MKVIVGVHAVTANGGVIAPVGMDMVALAAQKFAVPVVVVAGIHKLCPLYPENPEVIRTAGVGKVLRLHGFWKQLVSLVITDIRGHKPSYVYRLIADYYSSQDYVRYGKDALFKL
ncbi:unnamed protein product [Coffea canephora]|uniref:Translation initiation factor eIF2B subunit beta n=1 Tax=Coffea canephora TaxID=49390 RepID=A0A068TSL0_COFCA|nr:unnamed protein product [Coffea canephora]